MQETTPPHLYKLLSIEDWEKSAQAEFVHVPETDSKCIHFSKSEQLDRIITKYWSHIPAFVLLKIDTSKLEGTMIYETNPGGETKYYHLYNGKIPRSAVVEFKIDSKLKP